MIDPALPLQKAGRTALIADSVLNGLIGGQVYDRVPDDASFPYISQGDVQVLDSSDDCHDGAEAFIGFDIWSRAVGKVEAKQIAARAAVVLDAAFEVEGFEIIEHEIEQVRHLGDPDGLTSHSVVTARYVVAPTS